jgi:hypothetical protein
MTSEGRESSGARVHASGPTGFRWAATCCSGRPINLCNRHLASRDLGKLKDSDEVNERTVPYASLIASSAAFTSVYPSLASSDACWSQIPRCLQVETTMNVWYGSKDHVHARLPKRSAWRFGGRKSVRLGRCLAQWRTHVSNPLIPCSAHRHSRRRQLGFTV